MIRALANMSLCAALVLATGQGAWASETEEDSERLAVGGSRPTTYIPPPFVSEGEIEEINDCVWEWDVDCLLPHAARLSLDPQLLADIAAWLAENHRMEEARANFQLASRTATLLIEIDIPPYTYVERLIDIALRQQTYGFIEDSRETLQLANDWVLQSIGQQSNSAAYWGGRSSVEAELSYMTTEELLNDYIGMFDGDGCRYGLHDLGSGLLRIMSVQHEMGFDGDARNSLRTIRETVLPPLMRSVPTRRSPIRVLAYRVILRYDELGETGIAREMVQEWADILLYADGCVPLPYSLKLIEEHPHLADENFIERHNALPSEPDWPDWANPRGAAAP